MEVSGAQPPERSDAAATCVCHKWVIQGGTRHAGRRYLDDIWSFDFAQRVQACTAPVMHATRTRGTLPFPPPSKRTAAYCHFVFLHTTQIVKRWFFQGCTMVVILQHTFLHVI